MKPFLKLHDKWYELEYVDSFARPDSTRIGLAANGVPYISQTLNGVTRYCAYRVAFRCVN